MNRTIIALAGKVSILALSTAIGMGSYLVLKGKDDTLNGASSLVSLSRGGDFRPEIPFDGEPTLLARTESPVDISGDALGVLYVLQRDGKVIRVGNSGGTMSVSTRYADLQTEATAAEVGFSAIAFHPDFLVQERPGYGKFYVVVAEQAKTASPDFIPEFGYMEEHHQDVIYEFTTPHPLAGNFVGERREVVRFSQPGAENNLRSLTFDQYGRLYLAIGDGAVAEIGRRSPSRNASSLTSAYGKVLRIDPIGRSSMNGKYGIPDSNPFRLVNEALPELWAFGLRAPHSLYFDPFRGSLCIGESSHNGTEKVNVSELGGEHFGWDLSEGSYFFNRAAKIELESIVTSPTLALSRGLGSLGRSAGNVVYRGENFPSLAGRLLFASHDGRLMVCKPDGATDGVLPDVLDLGKLNEKSFSALRTAPTGELIVLCEDGSVYEMRKSESAQREKNPERKLFCHAAAWSSSKG